MRIAILVLCLSSLALATSGCGKTDAPPVKNGASASLVLAQEPAGATNVVDFKKAAKDGDEVVVVGRIGGSPKPFTGRAAFTIVDAALKPCNEREDDACPTPWDYCCDPPEDLAGATVLVRFVDAQGKTLADDARALLGVRELQTVVVRGHAKRDADQAVTVVASGIYVRK